MTMLTKMADALGHADGAGLSYEDMARAALQAIREPDDAMLRAGVLEAWTDPETVQKAHRAMIDAILAGEA